MLELSMVGFGNVRYVKQPTIVRIILSITLEIVISELPGKEKTQIKLEVVHRNDRRQTF